MGGQHTGSRVRPSLCSGSCRGPSSIPGCAFPFPTSSERSPCACYVPRSQGWLISHFLALGFALNLQPGRICCLVFFKKSYFRFFPPQFIKSYSKHFWSSTNPNTPPCCHHHQWCGVLAPVRPPFIPLNDKHSKHSQVLEYWGKHPSWPIGDGIGAGYVLAEVCELRCHQESPSTCSKDTQPYPWL